jgi:pyridoxal phosphate enzyme (YggS family)
MAVSKFHDADAVQSAIDAGQTLFGENRIQEAAAKFAEDGICGKMDSGEVELHIIGTVQRNKVKQAVQIASCIQTVDRLSLLQEIEKQAAKINKTMRVLYEFHTGEESKAGFTSSDELFAALEAASALPHIQSAGFMTMAPFTDNETMIRKSFAHLRETARAARERFPALPLTELSMGMSNDFSLAIQEGSTLVRVGTAIFGARQSI